MSDEVRGWRAVPLALLFGLAIELVFLIVRMCVDLGLSAGAYSERLELADAGIGVATYVLAFVGALELGKRLTGRAARGVRIATAGFGLAIALMIGLHVLSYFMATRAWMPDTVFTVSQYAWLVALLAMAVGFAVAAWERRVLAIAAVVVVCLTNPPHFLGDRLYSWLGLGFKGFLVLDTALRVIRIGLLLALAVAAARGAATPDPTRAAAGLRRIAAALWLRVIAAAAVPSISVLFALGEPHDAMAVFRFATLAAGIVSMVALLQFALGALAAVRADLAELPQAPCLIAGALTLWCVGVQAAQLPYTYQLLGGGSASSFSGESARGVVEALSVVTPLAAISAVALVVGAIAAFARRRGLDDLRAAASSKGVASVVLLVVSIAIQLWLLPNAKSTGQVVLSLIAGIGSGVGATMWMAELCTRAAAAVTSGPGLPTATAVSGAT